MDRAQQEFRQRIEQRWQSAIKTLPANPAVQTALQSGTRIGARFFGLLAGRFRGIRFSKLPLCSTSHWAAGPVQQALTRLFAASGTARTRFRTTRPRANDETAWRQKCWLPWNAATHPEAVSSPPRFLLDARRAVPSLVASAASVIVLEMEEISEGTLIRQAASGGSWLNAYQEGLLPLSSEILPWLRRMHEQCRRRNEKESWLLREKDLFRETRRIQWAEKFLPTAEPVAATPPLQSSSRGVASPSAPQ